MKLIARIARITGLILLIVLVVAALRWRAQLRDLALHADSLEAAADRTTQLALKASRDRSVWRRRAIQTELQRDALDRELNQSSVARADLALTVDRLTAQLASAGSVQSDAGDSVRRAHFDLRRAPYTVSADAQLPRAPAPGRLDLAIALDTARLSARVGCGPRGPGGVAPASLTVQGPPWLTVGIDTIRTATDVCSPAPALVPGVGLKLPTWLLVVSHAAALIGGVLIAK